MGPFLSESMMQRYAGQAAFERGVAYFYESRVAEESWGEGAARRWMGWASARPSACGTRISGIERRFRCPVCPCRCFAWRGSPMG